MASVPDVNVRQQISREVKRALSEAGLSARAAAAEMGVEPKTIYRWINEEVTAPLDALEAFGRAVGRPVTLSLGEHKEEAPTSDEAGAMSAFIRRWESDEPPPWAAGLTHEILTAVSGLHTEADALKEIRESLGAAARAAVREQQKRTPSEEAHDKPDSEESTPAESPAPPSQGGVTGRRSPLDQGL